MKGQIIVVEEMEMLPPRPPPSRCQWVDIIKAEKETDIYDGADADNVAMDINMAMTEMLPFIQSKPESEPSRLQHQQASAATALHRERDKIAELVARDARQNQLIDLIRTKRAMLLKKQAEVEKKQKSNQFLKNVVKDYSRYRNHIVDMKRQQLSAMAMLQRYVSDLEKSKHTVGAQLREARRDQFELTNEMDKLRGELDELVGKEVPKQKS